MPIQMTGEVINSITSERCLSIAQEFHSLTLQAKTEQSHEYAKSVAEYTALFLFRLSMATNKELVDPKLSGLLQSTIDACKDLGIQATQNGRSHNWVRSICFNAISVMQMLRREINNQ